LMKEIAAKKWWAYRGISSKLGMRWVEV
jgi:hypothetical protein